MNRRQRNPFVVPNVGYQCRSWATHSGFLLLSPIWISAQARQDAPESIAGIPVNYDEVKVGDYVLPDALTLKSGKTVRDGKT